MDCICTCRIAGFDLITEIRICLFYYKFSCKTRIKIPQSSWLIPHVTWAFSKLLVDKTQNNYTPSQACIWSWTQTIRKMTWNLHQCHSIRKPVQHQGYRQSFNSALNDSPEPPFFPEATKKKISPKPLKHPTKWHKSLPSTLQTLFLLLKMHEPLSENSDQCNITSALF